MALADLLLKIERDAALEADRIRSEGAQQARKVLADAENRVRGHDDNRRALTRAKAEARVETVLAKARVEGRDLVLEARRDMIDKAFTSAADAISRLKDSEWLAIYMPFIIELGRSGEMVLLGSEDESRRQALSTALAGIEAASLRVSKDPAPFKHGIYLVGEKTRVSLSVNEIINAKRRVLEPKVAAILATEKSSVEV